MLKSSLFQSQKKLCRKSSNKYCQEWFPKKSESVLQVPRTLDQMPSFEKRSKGQKVIKIFGGYTACFGLFHIWGCLRYSEGEKKTNKNVDLLVALHKKSWTHISCCCPCGSRCHVILVDNWVLLVWAEDEAAKWRPRHSEVTQLKINMPLLPGEQTASQWHHVRMSSDIRRIRTFQLTSSGNILLL